MCKIFNRHQKCLISIPKGLDNLYCISIEQLKHLSNPKCDNNINDSNSSQIIQVASEPIIKYEPPSEILMNELPVFIAYSKDVNVTELIHRRLCHANINGIISSLRNNRFSGINVDVHQLNPQYFCDVCPLSKSIARPFTSNNQSNNTGILQLIFTDVCGPYGVPSKGGNRYIITFIDNFSKFVGVYPMKLKSDATMKLIDVNNEVKSLHKANFGTIHSDFVEVHIIFVEGILST